MPAVHTRYDIPTLVRHTPRLLYSGKLSREKTLAKWDISRGTVCMGVAIDIARMRARLRRVRMRQKFLPRVSCHAPKKIRGENICGTAQISEIRGSFLPRSHASG